MTPNGDVLDVDEHAGTVMDAVLLADVLGTFEREDGRTVPAMARPKDHLTVDPGVLGGYPVMVGTRVPFDVVAGLAEEGYSDAEIIDLYPNVGTASIEDARSFAQDVAAAA